MQELNKKQKESDKFFDENVKEAKTDKNKACDLYRNYIGKAETDEERKRRINRFRSGGY